MIFQGKVRVRGCAELGHNPCRNRPIFFKNVKLSCKQYLAPKCIRVNQNSFEVTLGNFFTPVNIQNESRKKGFQDEKL